MSSDELVQWKSHIGLSLSSDRKILRATAKGWGRSGALTDALLTRTGTLEGFLATLPQNTASIFIGFTNLSGSLYDQSRAHQEDLDFSIRISSAGELSYQSKARMMQYAYSPHLESDTVCTVEKGDIIGMRLTADRRGIQIIKEAQLGVRLQEHPNLIRLFGVLEIPDRGLALVLELADGGALSGHGGGAEEPCLLAGEIADRGKEPRRRREACGAG